MNNEKKLLVTIILNIVITVSQFIAGIISGSLALMSDALHNFSDVISLVVSYIAERLSKKEFTKNKTFGYKRAEVIAALINSITLIIISTFLLYNAITGFFKTEAILSEYVIALAIVSILLNGLSAYILYSGSKKNINMKSSYIHLLSDMLTSIAVLIGGLAMYIYELYWVDPLITIFIALYLLREAYGLIKEVFHILMNFTPKELDMEGIYNAAKNYPEVKNFHHIHVWNLTGEGIYFQAHMDLEEDYRLSEVDNILIKVEKDLIENFNISHCILQPEFKYNDSKELIVD